MTAGRRRACAAVRGVCSRRVEMKSLGANIDIFPEAEKRSEASMIATAHR